MEREINNIIREAIRDDWYNKMTTSDLQATCEAIAMGIYNKNNIDTPRSYPNRFINIMNIQGEILNGIYKNQEL
ncbi:MAG: hypothetical protein WC374_04310 [Phycisphaerae bacterium]|jgi:hypothetical protein